MTSGNVNNFVSDLVLMAKAMEELPHVQQALTASEAEANRLATSVQAREESILRLKAEIEALQAKVRSTEVERDDAELRFLELDEKAHQVDAILRSIMVSAEHGKDLVAPPPAPEPVPVPQAEAEVKHEEPLSAAPSSAYAPDGTVSPGEQHPFEGSGGGLSQPLPVTSFEEVPKSDANPPQDTALGQPIDSGPSASYSGASTTENASANTTIDSAVDDVGYHNEPDVGTDWTAWNAWCERMHKRYAGAWPMRPDNAAPSVA